MASPSQRTQATLVPKPEPPKIDRRTADDRRAEGKELRKKVPRSSHAGWKTFPKRHDPIVLLKKSSEGRVKELIPIRYGRMIQSPFTFFRGAAAIMAADLAHTPSTGIYLQACGDCHLLNFGGFGSPERKLLFDINDFDETLPGPWEWDVKRLAASFVIAGRNNGFKKAQNEDSARACARSYREWMAQFSEMPTMEVWYYHMEVEALMKKMRSEERKKQLAKKIRKLRAHSVAEDDFPKLATTEGNRPVIRDNPPLIYHPQNAGEKDFQERVRIGLEHYRRSLADDRKALFDRYEFKDIAIKVVGVGSVGTRCGVMLLMAGPNDPLFLQVKEARHSVLEPFAGEGAYENQGERVVQGQRLMQSASDIFLGWVEGIRGYQFYIRQLRDMKLKPTVETYDPPGMELYAELCGWALARAHARSGDAAKISGYLGTSDAFDQAMADFAEQYADQNEKDHQALLRAVRAGRIEVYVER